MKKTAKNMSIVLMVMFAMILSGYVSAETPRDLAWEELIPPDLTREQIRKGTLFVEDKAFGIDYVPEAFPAVESLNGKFVRMPGFMLPLEFSGTAVTEFLLVPYVGACIHVPPPLPIQIVYVQSEELEYKNRALYDPVWVTGTMTTARTHQNLEFVDGSEDIQVGYSMEATAIEPINMKAMTNQ